jgi:hypothetical protein
MSHSIVWYGIAGLLCACSGAESADSREELGQTSATLAGECSAAAVESPTTGRFDYLSATPPIATPPALAPLAPNVTCDSLPSGSRAVVTHVKAEFAANHQQELALAIEQHKQASWGSKAVKP